LIPDGVGIKNYLYAGVFKDPNISVALFHNFDEDTLNLISKYVKIEEFEEIPRYKETVKEKFLRELIHLVRLKFNKKQENNATILKFWKRSHKGFKLNLFYIAVLFASNFVTSYKQILRLEIKYDVSLRKNVFYLQVKAILQDHLPDQLFCTHQRALKAPTVFQAAKDLEIPTATVIYSWDNLPKARLALKADKYLVWSQHMKKELGSFYPEISHEKIIVTGTPQFEFYNDPEHIIPQEEFYNNYGLDHNKSLICFSGDDTRTSPYDPEYLNDLAEALLKEGLDSKCTVVFRRCPVDISGRYDWVIKKFPNLIVEIPPLWNFNSNNWTAVHPTFQDIKLLVSLSYYADMVVNVGSTMAFDFGMFHKPCIYINYDVKIDKNWSVKTIYKYQHFRSMPSEKAVYWFNDKEEIGEVVKNALENPRTEIQNWFDLVVNYPETASERILKELT
jgi:hypothetical protein